MLCLWLFYRKGNSKGQYVLFHSVFSTISVIFKTFKSGSARALNFVTRVKPRAVIHHYFDTECSCGNWIICMLVREFYNVMLLLSWKPKPQKFLTTPPFFSLQFLRSMASFEVSSQSRLMGHRLSGVPSEISKFTQLMSPSTPKPFALLDRVDGPSPLPSVSKISFTCVLKGFGLGASLLPSLRAEYKVRQSAFSSSSFV